MKKRWIAVLLVLCLFVGLLGGCARDGKANASVKGRISKQAKAEKLIREQLMTRIGQGETLGERKEAVEAVLKSVVKTGEVRDYTYDETHEVYLYTYSDDTPAAISLQELPEEPAEDMLIDPAEETPFFDGLDAEDAGKLNVMVLNGFEDSQFRSRYYERWMQKLSEKAGFADMDDDVTVEDLKTLGSEYDVVVLSVYGQMLGDKPCLVLNEEVTQKTEEAYAKELLDDQSVVRVFCVDGEWHYFVLPEFFRNSYDETGLAGKTILSDASSFFGCDCMGEAMNEQMADALLACGAVTVFGFRNDVTETYGRGMIEMTVDGLMNGVFIAYAAAAAKSYLGSDDGVLAPENDKYPAYCVIRGVGEEEFAAAGMPEELPVEEGPLTTKWLTSQLFLGGDFGSFTATVFSPDGTFAEYECTAVDSELKAVSLFRTGTYSISGTTLTVITDDGTEHNLSYLLTSETAAEPEEDYYLWYALRFASEAEGFLFETPYNGTPLYFIPGYLSGSAEDFKMVSESTYSEIVSGLLSRDGLTQGYGMLFDANGDGTDELLLKFEDTDGIVRGTFLCAAVYTIIDGKAVPVIPETRLCPAAGIPYSKVGVISFGGKTYLAATGGIGSTEMGAGRDSAEWYLVPADDLSNMTTVEWSRSFEGYDWEQDTYFGESYEVYWNGTLISEEEYEQWQNGIEITAVVDYFDALHDKGLPLEELYGYLVNN